MKPVFQEIIAVGKGDCLSACFASILEIPLIEVPKFMGQTQCSDRLISRWLSARGLLYVEMIPFDGKTPMPWIMQVPDNTYCTASVPSQKFEGSWHAVVMQMSTRTNEDGHSIFEWKIVHDPNPENKPYEPGIMPRFFGFLVPANIAQWARLPA